ncbi:MAG: hypothetical protein LBB46_03785, partial [Coriobacteriaceae bacterium]|nr:hypothetical protein [Coriobacteriaceae bacterium]
MGDPQNGMAGVQAAESLKTGGAVLGASAVQSPGNPGADEAALGTAAAESAPAASSAVEDLEVALKHGGA